MSVVVAEKYSEAVRVSVQTLVKLSQAGANLPLKSKQILSRQGGDYQSPFKGRGMEYDESRLYQPGDDIRNLDWRVTARTGKPYTKLFREERERPVFVWVDYRAPMFFATRGKYKSVMAAHMASLLAWSAINHGDRIGGIIFSEQIHHEFKPLRGKSGVLHLIKNLSDHPSWDQPPSSGNNIQAGARALMRLRRVARPGSLIFLLSDFRHFDETACSQLVRLSQHNDVAMIFIHDPLEETLPRSGRYRLSNGPREVVIDTYDSQFVDDYSKQFAAHRDKLERLSRTCRINLLMCSTIDDPFQILYQGLCSR
jgi:uncharacterized protein (DUF58 family)